MVELDNERERMRLSLLKDKTLKSFIKVGNAYIDIKDCFSFSFEDNPDGYVFVKFRSMYDMAKVMKMPIDNRNDLCQFFLELEAFFDDPNMVSTLNKLIDDVEALKYKSYVESVIKDEQVKPMQDKKPSKKKTSNGKKKDSDDK